MNDRESTRSQDVLAADAAPVGRAWGAASRRARARLRRLDRMKRRGLSLARGACVACPVMALLWVLGLWYDLPSWATLVVGLGSLLGIGLLTRVASRGRNVVPRDFA